MLTRWLAFARGILRRQAIEREVEEELAFISITRRRVTSRSASRRTRRAAWRRCSSAARQSCNPTWRTFGRRGWRCSGAKSVSASAPWRAHPRSPCRLWSCSRSASPGRRRFSVCSMACSCAAAVCRVRGARACLVEERRAADRVPLRLAGRLRGLAGASAGHAPAGCLRTTAGPRANRRPGGPGHRDAGVTGAVCSPWRRADARSGIRTGRRARAGRPAESRLLAAAVRRRGRRGRTDVEPRPGDGARDWRQPARFEVANATADVWLPLDTNVGIPSRYAHTLRVLARTTGRADPDAVRRDLDVIAAQLAEERPAENGGWRVTVQSLFDTVVSPELRRSLWITAGAVLFVLLLATTSVAGLVLVRSASRERELAVRVALGASRGSLVRLLLLECLVLSTVAGALGLVAAVWGVSLLRDTGDALIPRLDEVRVNARVFAATAAMSLVAALLAGVVPAWRSTRSLNERLRHRGVASDPGVGRAMPLLVVVELSSAVLLVVGAALLVQTVRNLHARPLGFESEPLLSVAAVRPQGVDGPQALAHVQRVLNRLASIPGVAVVAAGSAAAVLGTEQRQHVRDRRPAGRRRTSARYRLPRRLAGVLRRPGCGDAAWSHLRGHGPCARCHRAQPDGGAALLVRARSNRQPRQAGTLGLADRSRGGRRCPLRCPRRSRRWRSPDDVPPALAAAGGTARLRRAREHRPGLAGGRPAAAMAHRRGPPHRPRRDDDRADSAGERRAAVLDEAGRGVCRHGGGARRGRLVRPARAARRPTDAGNRRAAGAWRDLMGRGTPDRASHAACSSWSAS